jgi:hypothetical protein
MSRNTSIASRAKTEMSNYRRLITTYVALFSCVGCTGCGGFLNPAAESSVSLQGKVIDIEPRATCHLQLYGEKGQPRGELTMTPEFKQSLVIAPGAHKYYVEVSCEGHPGKFRSAVYELGGGAKTLNLGTIVLTRE